MCVVSCFLQLGGGEVGERKKGTGRDEELREHDDQQDMGRVEF